MVNHSVIDYLFGGYYVVIIWLLYGYYMVNNNLLGGIPTPLKMMEFVSWDDDIPFPTEWKFTKFQTTN